MISVDTLTGNRTQVATDIPSNDDGVSDLRGIALDRASNRVFVADEGLSEILEVDLLSGTTTVFANEQVGRGPNLGSPNNLVLDLDQNRLLVMNSSVRSGVMAIDLDSGIRRVLSSNEVGFGVSGNDGRDLALDRANNRILVVDRNAHLYSLNLESGAREYLSNSRSSEDAVGSGPAIGEPIAIAADLENDRAFILDRVYRSIILVDLPTGSRGTLSR